MGSQTTSTGKNGSPAAAADAAAEGLHYVSDEDPGLRRSKRGKGFIYLDRRGRRVMRDDVIGRIRSLAIPPAYTDVWICPDPRGHLQATGRDARGRKQYRYHPRWRRVRDQGKFEHMWEFGTALPRIRRMVSADLRRKGWPKEKVLALVVRLLDQTLIRVGNESYANENGNYGLTTLRGRHVRSGTEGLRLCFSGKSGRKSDVTVSDKRLVRLLRRVQQLPGQRLFQYLDDEGQLHAVDSGMVNDYLREAGGGDFTAKDFRTWSGTVHAIGELACIPLPPGGRTQHRQKKINEVIRVVADLLRNTPAVCRRSYIHPQAFKGWEDGSLQRVVSLSAAKHPRMLERATLRFLRRR
jgi:DNA topoisomerase I